MEAVVEHAMPELSIGLVTTDPTVTVGCRKFMCLICGYIYDEENGDPTTDVAPGTRWEDLPEGWVCPECGAPKSDFEEIGNA